MQNKNKLILNKKIIYKLFPKLYEFLSKNSIYKYKFYKLNENSFFHSAHKVNNPEYISIGKEVTLEKDAWLNVISDKNSHGCIEIQDRANLGMRVTISSANKIIIGENVLIGINVYISDHEHRYEDINIPIIYQGIKGKGTVEISSNAWIGNNVVILASTNLKIGKHSIIGANSVVKESIPDYSIAVGNPAKVVKKYNEKLKKWVKLASRI